MNKKKGRRPTSTLRKKKSNNNAVIYIAIAIFLLLIGFRVLTNEEEAENIPTINEVAQSVRTGAIESIIIRGNTVELTYPDGTLQKIKKEPGSEFDETLIRYGVTAEQLRKTQYEIKDQVGFKYWFGIIVPFLIPLLFLILLFWFLFGHARGMGMQALNFGRSRAQEVDPNDKKKRITFADVAGADEAKQEMMEFVDFLKNPDRFIAIGAKVPKGVLLSGSPGTGKTLLARAVAGEARVPFFSVSGSEFVEMFVGVGAARVRDLFRNAKERAPAIIFIDEIDAIGRMRGGSVGGGNDEREQALNQILVEMDGFDPADKVIVLAASNRPDVLDSALVRTGRFDRKVIIGLPDKEERKQILEVHMKGKKFGLDVDMDVIARRTIGFSGADLAAVVNEGAIRAVRNNRTEILQEDLREAIEKVILGPERKNKIPDEHERKVIAYHEAGHALLGSILPSVAPVEKISIVSRGHVGGYVMNAPEKERRLKTKQEFFENIIVLLGGYTAEKIIFGDVTTGPSNDLERVAEIAHDMVTRFGMSSSIGPLVLHRLHMGINGPIQGTHSNETEQSIDEEISVIVQKAEKEAKKYIKKHVAALDRIVDELSEHETLEREEFEQILKEEGVKIQNNN